MLNWLSNLSASLLAYGLVSALLLLVIGIVVIRLVSHIVTNALAKSKLEKAGHSLILNLLRTVLYILLGLIVAAALGIDVTSVVALASVLTLSVSLALQNMLANVFGGFTILYTHPFHSGDFVEIAGQSGTVQEINMTYTRLATPDNRQISIPNSSVVAAQIVNYSANDTRRLDVSVSVAYRMDEQTVIDALVVAGTIDKVLLEPAPFAGILAYSEGTVTYVLRIWCSTPDYWDVYYAVHRNIKKVFTEQGIQISFPHVNVHLDK